jgi:hypothetical protein
MATSVIISVLGVLLLLLLHMLPVSTSLIRLPWH